MSKASSFKTHGRDATIQLSTVLWMDAGCCYLYIIMVFINILSILSFFIIFIFSGFILVQALVIC